MFNVGDEVLCTSSRTGNLDGKIGIVKEVHSDHLIVSFKGRQYPIEMFSWRFEHVDKDLKDLSPVCFKIRQMEKRWNKFQLLKTHNNKEVLV